MHTIKGAWAVPTFALVTCNDSRGRKARIKRSKEERKYMAETFIKTYQKSNDGKFPSLNLTHKEVGGSFYTVREIVREIIQENRVLGPAKLHSEEGTDQISLEQYPLGSLCIETPTSLSSTGETHVITDAASEKNVLDSNSHLDGAGISLDNGEIVSTRIGRIKGNEVCEEPATTDVTRSCDGNIQEEQLLHSNGEFPVSYGQKLHNEEALRFTETIEKDNNSSKSGQLINASIHQQDVTENQVYYPSINVSEACNQSLNELIIDKSCPTVEKDQESGESVYVESLVRDIPDENGDGIEELEASKSGITHKGADILQAMSTTIDYTDGKLSETGDASHETRQEQDSKNFSENCSGLMNEKVDATLEGPGSEGNNNVVKMETLLESGESSLQISTSSSMKVSSGSELKAVDSSAVIKTSNGSSSSSQTTSVAKESLAINNTPSVPQNSIHQKGYNPPISRTNLETRKSAKGTSKKSEPNPLLALLKAFITAFMKFWTEE